MSLFFKEECERVANQTGVELMDTYEDTGKNRVFEDDGILHVVNEGTRAAFDVSFNQSVSRNVQNSYTRDILGSLGIPVTANALA